MKNKLSVIILTRNEEEKIFECIKSAYFADEIIIIDDYSKDNTLRVIKKLNHPNIKVFRRELNDNYSNQRNFGLDKAIGDWILFVDADETVSKELASEIKQVICVENNSVAGYFIKRFDFLWGKRITHGELLNFKLLRLAKKNKGRWMGRVHEEWRIDGSTEALNNPLIHKPHESIREFLYEINFYTSIRAKELFDKGVRTNLIEIIFYPKSKFILNYIFKLGFLDGVEGFLLSIFMTFHSFLVRAKLYQLWKTK